jgi:hypothetical protein
VRQQPRHLLSPALREDDIIVAAHHQGRRLHPRKLFFDPVCENQLNGGPDPAQARGPVITDRPKAERTVLDAPVAQLPPKLPPKAPRRRINGRPLQN